MFFSSHPRYRVIHVISSTAHQLVKGTEDFTSRVTTSLPLTTFLKSVSSHNENFLCTCSFCEPVRLRRGEVLQCERSQKDQTVDGETI